MLTSLDRCESADLDRAAVCDDRAALGKARSFFHILGIDDRVATKRQRATRVASNATVAEDRVTEIDKRIADFLEHASQAAKVSGVPA